MKSNPPIFQTYLLAQSAHFPKVSCLFASRLRGTAKHTVTEYGPGGARVALTTALNIGTALV